MVAPTNLLMSADRLLAFCSTTCTTSPLIKIEALTSVLLTHQSMRSHEVPFLRAVSTTNMLHCTLADVYTADLYSGEVKKGCVLAPKNHQLSCSSSSLPKPLHDDDAPTLQFIDGLSATIDIHSFGTSLHIRVDIWVALGKMPNIKNSFEKAGMARYGDWMTILQHLLG